MDPLLLLLLVVAGIVLVVTLLERANKAKHGPKLLFEPDEDYPNDD